MAAATTVWIVDKSTLGIALLNETDHLKVRIDFFGQRFYEADLYFILNRRQCNYHQMPSTFRVLLISNHVYMGVD